MAPSKRHSTAALFYGFPLDHIAQVLCITKQTACMFKTGLRKPGPVSLKLWTLHIEGRILDDEQWHGWRVFRNEIVDPEGNISTQTMLRAYAHVWALARELTRADPAARSELDRISSIATQRIERTRRTQADERSELAEAPKRRTG